MSEDRVPVKYRRVGFLACLALIGALLVPLSVAVTSGTSGAIDPCITNGVTQGTNDFENELCCPNDLALPDGATQGGGIDDVCCADELTQPWAAVAQGQDVGVKCCPDGTYGHWQWGGYSGQNLYYCDAPPNEPPATAAPATDPSAVSPATVAPKQAAAAKPTFTG